MGLQSAHEWSHTTAHDASEQENHSHCDHGHYPTAVSSPEGVAVASLDECAVCEWDWLPAGSIDAKNLDIPCQQWCQASNEGAVNAGYARNHCNQAKSHRGPPWNG